MSGIRIKLRVIRAWPYRQIAFQYRLSNTDAKHYSDLHISSREKKKLSITFNLPQMSSASVLTRTWRTVYTLTLQTVPCSSSARASSRRSWTVRPTWSLTQTSKSAMTPTGSLAATLV